MNTQTPGFAPKLERVTHPAGFTSLRCPECGLSVAPTHDPGSNDCIQGYYEARWERGQ